MTDSNTNPERARSDETGRAAPVYTDDPAANAMMDFLDERADAWMLETHIVSATHAMCAPFAKYASHDILERFRKMLEAQLHLCFVEGGFRSWEEISTQQRALGSPLPAFAASERPERETGEVRVERWRKAALALGSWMSAALDDPKVCDAMKADINEWFSAGEPFEALATPLPSGGDQSQAARVGELEAAVKLTLADASYHLNKYRPHCLEALKTALSVQSEEDHG